METIKLNKINILSDELKNKVMGGASQPDTDEDYCSCGCCYENNGGSSTEDNKVANFERCLKTKCANGEKVYEM